jgi:hypothetical protein
MHFKNSSLLTNCINENITSKSKQIKKHLQKTTYHQHREDS